MMNERSDDIWNEETTDDEHEARELSEIITIKLIDPELEQHVSAVADSVDRGSLFDSAPWVLGRYYSVLGSSVRVTGHTAESECGPAELEIKVMRTQRTHLLSVATWLDLIEAGLIVDD